MAHIWYLPRRTFSGGERAVDPDVVIVPMMKPVRKTDLYFVLYESFFPVILTILLICIRIR